MGFHCECGAVLSSEYNLRRHKVRTCRGGDYFPQCQDCGVVYRSVQSLNQHRRQAHPESYNSEMEVEAARARPKRRWSELEVQQMATLEAAFSGPRSEVNKYLASQLSRTTESVKAKRRCESYKASVVAIRQRQERQSEGVVEEPTHRLSDDEDGFATPPSSPEGYKVPLRASTGVMLPLEASSMADSDGADMSISASVNGSVIGTEGLRDKGTAGNIPFGSPSTTGGNDGHYEQDPVREYLVQLSEAESYGAYMAGIQSVLSGCVPNALS